MRGGREMKRYLRSSIIHRTSFKTVSTPLEKSSDILISFDLSEFLMDEMQLFSNDGNS